MDMEEKLEAMVVGSKLNSSSDGVHTTIVRVHGGWIYIFRSDVGITSQCIPEPELI